MAKGKVIGIDLGTTNSCVAIMEGGQPVVMLTQKADVQPLPLSLSRKRAKGLSEGQPNVRQSLIRRTPSSQSKGSWVAATMKWSKSVKKYRTK